MNINGTNAIIEALKKQSKGVIYIHTQHKSYRHIVALAKKNNCTIQIVPLHELKTQGARQGVMFKIERAPPTYIPSLKQWLNERKTQGLCILILDHILDPQNLGAILRSAALFDVDVVIQPERRTAPENDVCARSAAGAFSIIQRYYENNLANTIRLLQEHNVWIFALDMNGKNIASYNIPERTAFILGNEHKGVSRLLKEKSDDVLSIPNNKILDSLNVSVSAGIACYEYYRQKI